MTPLGKSLALMLIVITISAAPAEPVWGQTQTLTAFYTAPVVSMAPMWIAKEAGYFAGEYLDVELIRVGGRDAKKPMIGAHGDVATERLHDEYLGARGQDRLFPRGDGGHVAVTQERVSLGHGVQRRERLSGRRA